MENIALEVFDRVGTGSQFAALEPDTSITITRTSRIFGSGDVWTHSFKLNVAANAYIFGTSGELHGARLHEQINKRRARLWVMGQAMFFGIIKLDDEVDVDEEGFVDISLESGRKTFEDMLDGMSARDVSVGDDVILGRALKPDRDLTLNGIAFHWKLDSDITVKAGEEYGSIFADRTFVYINRTGVGNIPATYTQKWPKMVITHGGPGDLDYTNIQNPYDAAHPFCNINVCYQKKYKDAEGNEQATHDYIVRLGHGNYGIGGDGYTRINNSPNFYLLYWLDRLMLDLGITVQENQCMDVEDLRRVFLANLGCFYKEGTSNTVNIRLEVLPKLTVFGDGNEDNGSLLATTLSIVKRNGGRAQDTELVKTVHNQTGKITLVEWAESEVRNITKRTVPGQGGIPESGYYIMPANLAIATSDNYPKVDAQEIIDAMQDAFGVRFVFNEDYTTVRILLLKNIFANPNNVIQIGGDTIETTKQENSIRGFVLSYGGSEDDTVYNYDFKSTTVETGYSYNQITRFVNAFNKTCYITPNNGNSYRIKIDEDETVFFPSLFEVAGYADAKDGDCTGEEDTIKTITIKATPLLMNNVDGTYAVFVDEDFKAPGEQTIMANDYIWPLSQINTSDEPVWKSGDSYVLVGSGVNVYIKEGYTIRLSDNYTYDEDGNTPFDKVDLGLCFGVMRSSGSDAYVRYTEDVTEDEGNDYWEQIPGKGAIDHPDTCDNEGNIWDYNGDSSDEGDLDGRFSLKLRAEKPNPDFDPTLPESQTNQRYLPITDPGLRHRGLADQFYKDYSYWVTHARISNKKRKMGLGDIQMVDDCVRIEVDDVTGFMNQMQFTVDMQTGIGDVNLQILYI